MAQCSKGRVGCRRLLRRLAQRRTGAGMFLGKESAVMPSVHIRTMFVAVLAGGIGCVEEHVPCDAAAALAAAPASIALVEGGRGFLAMPRTADVSLRVDGLIAGFTTRRREDGIVVVTAPYGISGTLPARLDATCDDGDRATQRIDLVVAALRVQPIASLTGPGPRTAPGMAVVDAGVLVVGGFDGATPLADVWLLPRGTTEWRRLDVDTGVGAGAVRATAMADRRRVLLLGPGGATALADLADLADVAGGATSITPLAPGGAVPVDSDGASLLHVPAGAGVGLTSAALTTTLAVCGKGAERHCRVTAFDDDGSPAPWRVLEPTGFAPVGREGAIVAIDLESRRLVLFGGETDEGPAADAWVLSLTSVADSEISWAHLGGDAEPAARRGACGALDPVGHRLLVVGGVDDLGPARELLAYDLEAPAEDDDDQRAWREVGVDGLPGSTEGCSAAWDPLEERLVVGFGGEGAELWALDVSP